MVRRYEELHRLGARSSTPKLASSLKERFHRIDPSAPLNFKGREIFPQGDCPGEISECLMAHPHCVIEEPAFTKHCNCLPVGLAGVTWIFRLDEQERDLSKQVGIVRFGLEGLTVERNRLAPVAEASPPGSACCSPKNLVLI